VHQFANGPLRPSHRRKRTLEDLVRAREDLKAVGGKIQHRGESFLLRQAVATAGKAREIEWIDVLSESPPLPKSQWRISELTSRTHRSP